MIDVLWEAKTQQDDGETVWSGYSDNYIRVQTQARVDLFNRVTLTRLYDPKPSGMSGTVAA